MTQILILNKYRLNDHQLATDKERYKKTWQPKEERICGHRLMEEAETEMCFPLKYKERLQTKYLKYPKNKPSLESGCWHFLNAGVDDFSDDCPILSGAQRGVSPVIFHETPKRSTSRQVPRKRYSKEQVCFSKQMIQKQIRREHVAAVEEKLKHHPLALYPYYKDYMNPELFDKALSVLDPDMCINSASAVPPPAAERVEEEDEGNYSEPSKEEVEQEDRAELGTSATEINPEIKNPSPKNPYRRLQISENGAKEDQRASVKQLSSLFQEEDIEKVTKLFGDWFTSLGGGTNIIESAILGHYVSDFETPSLSFAIQEGEADNLPEERCNSVTTTCRQDNDVSTDFEPNMGKPGTKNTIYEECYLHPETCRKKRDAEEIQEELEFKLPASEKDGELKQMYVTQAFRQYIIRNGLRMPRFLSNLFSEEEQEAPKRGGSDAFGSVSAWKGNVVNL